MEELKIKSLTKSQILISIDRLTRFKSTEDKYLRVFRDVIISNLISPKFKKNQLDAMPYERLKNYAEEILNFSINYLNFGLSDDLTINKKLIKYENSVFKFDKNVQVLLENRIDYKSALKLFVYDELPLNLKWLSLMDKDNPIIQERINNALKFPIEKIIITEGITEEILLPKFAKLCGYDFDKYGINLISAGGKNQVVKLVYTFAEILKLPMFVLLDSDAKENFEEILPRLRKFDKVHVIADGEFEDILPINLIKKTLNNYLKNFSSVTLEDLRQDLPMTKILEEIFKTKGFNEFKKAEFANLVAQNISSVDDVSPEIMAIVQEIKTT